jgi:hypothetical protein
MNVRLITNHERRTTHDDARVYYIIPWLQILNDE